MNTLITYPNHIAALKPYLPGKPISEVARVLPGVRIAKLASNENPLGASPRAIAALSQSSIDLSQYPDNECTDLVAALSEFHGIDREMFVAGAGSESVIGTAVSTLLTVGRKTSYAQYSFQAYVNAAQRVGALAMTVPSPDFHVDLAGLSKTLEHEPALVYIANPGNPTGTCAAPDELEAFIRSVPPHIVAILDEAYYEYMPSEKRLDSVRLATELPNLLVTRTFSKAYGLAGLRIGYGIAHKGLAEMLRRVRAPFIVTEGAQRAAIAALEDRDFLARTIDINSRSKSELESGLRGLGFEVISSETNFLLVQVKDGSSWARRLEGRGLIVRPVNSYGLSEWLRISVGTLEDTHRLIASFGDEITCDSETVA